MRPVLGYVSKDLSSDEALLRCESLKVMLTLPNTHADDMFDKVAIGKIHSLELRAA